MCWKITETNQFDDQAVDRLGNKFLIGNGYIGYRGTLEEHTKEHKVATIVSGLYDQVGTRWREPVNMPNGCYVQIVYQGTPLHAQTGRVESHTQTLDMRRGIHERRTTFVTGDGNTITVCARRFASLANHHLICLHYTVRAARDCVLIIRTGIDGDVWDLNGPHLCNIRTFCEDGVIALTAHTHERGVPIAVSECVAFADGSQTCVREEKRIIREVRLPVAAGHPQSIAKFVALYTGIDADDPLAAGRELSQAAAQIGFDRLQEEHCARWEDRWERCDVEIEGDEEAQLALRFSLYHLLAVAPTHADNVSIPARGLSGQVYKGAIFWDTEIFMLPFFTYTFPSIARNLLMYRYRTLDGARRKAQEHGFRGAFYAWESQDSGDDACTLFNVTDVFTNRPIRTYFRDKQIHISADVAYAIWEHFSATGDDSILLDGGAEIICECARFFLSYLYYSPERRRYEVLDVTGPDEYHERVHNDAYTNWMVAHTLDVCLRMCAYLQEYYPEQVQALLERLDFGQDLASIRVIAKRLYLPKPDPQSSVIPQFDGYFSLEDVALDDLLRRKLHPHEYLGGGNGLATTTQIIKQADVILALYLFGNRYPREVKAANWEYYEPRTEHGSSLSACSYALVAAQIGKVDRAYEYFIKTAAVDLTGESKQYVGTLYIGGTHPAANGGAWMAAVFGLCGISCSDQTITIQPRLPEHWTKVTVPLIFRGQRLVIELSRNQVVVHAMRPLQTEIHIRVEDNVLSLSEEVLAIPLCQGQEQ